MPETNTAAPRFPGVGDLAKKGTDFFSNAAKFSLTGKSGEDSARKKELEKGRNALLRLAAQQQNTVKLLEENLSQAKIENLDLPDIDNLAEKILNREAINEKQAKEFIEGIKETAKQLEVHEDQLTISMKSLTEGIDNLIENEQDPELLRGAISNMTDSIKDSNVELSESQKESLAVLTEIATSQDEIGDQSVDVLKAAMADFRDDSSQLKILDNLRDLNHVSEKLFLSSEGINDELDRQTSEGNFLEDFLKNSGDFSMGDSGGLFDMFGSMLGLGPLGQAFSGLTPLVMGATMLFGRFGKIIKALIKGVKGFPALMKSLGGRLGKAIAFIKNIPAMISKLLSKLPGLGSLSKAGGKLVSGAGKVAGTVGTGATGIAGKALGGAGTLATKAGGLGGKLLGKGAAKAGVKGILTAGKAIPFIGTAIGAGFVVHDLWKIGKKLAAGKPISVRDAGVLTADLGTLIPGIGTGAAVASIAAEALPDTPLFGEGSKVGAGSKEIVPGNTVTGVSQQQPLIIPMPSGGGGEQVASRDNGVGRGVDRSLSIEETSLVMANFGG